MGKRKSKIHYVDNARFLEEMIEYKKQYKISIKNNKELPMISEYLGSVFLKIAQRLSFRPNFINYAFKDDMISDGIENCLMYAHNFDPEKSKEAGLSKAKGGSVMMRNPYDYQPRAI